MGIVKNLFMPNAYVKSVFEIDIKKLAGQVAAVFSFEDPLAGIKTTASPAGKRVGRRKKQIVCTPQRTARRSYSATGETRC